MIIMDQLFIASLTNFYNRNGRLQKPPHIDGTPDTRLQTALQKLAKLSNPRVHVDSRTSKRVLPHCFK